MLNQLILIPKNQFSVKKQQGKQNLLIYILNLYLTQYIYLNIIQKNKYKKYLGNIAIGNLNFRMGRFWHFRIGLILS